jgi:hypothetical protein
MMLVLLGMPMTKAVLKTWIKLVITTCTKLFSMEPNFIERKQANGCIGYMNLLQGSLNRRARKCALADNVCNFDNLASM